MAAYIPAPIRERVSALNDNYNPLAAANRPSIAHGKYLYVMGMAYVPLPLLSHFFPQFLSTLTAAAKLRRSNTIDELGRIRHATEGGGNGGDASGAYGR